MQINVIEISLVNNADEGLAIEQTAAVPNDLQTKKQLRLAFPKDKYLNVAAMYMTEMEGLEHR